MDTRRWPPTRRLLEQLASQAGGRLSIEDVLSGPGAAATVLGPGAGRRNRIHPPERIMQSAAHSESPARETLEVFVRLLGSVAGNLALTLNARGGVYLAGGVLQSVGTEHWESVFRAAFIGK
ncbi:MAG: glucokinase, partial [Gammaproteobacteria bacterium]